MDFLKRLEKWKLAVLAVAAASLLGFVVMFLMMMAKPEMISLYNNLSGEEGQAIAARLQLANIPFNSSPDLSQIWVPSEKVLSARMILAQERLPARTARSGYELFDKSESILGVSEFVNNVNFARALEGELSRTISSLSPIETARVHLVLPKRELFSRTGAVPSASVVLKIVTGKNLTKEQIQGITHLLVTAVPGLQTENVTLVDSKGNILRLTEETEDNDKIVLDQKKKLEDSLKSQLEALLTKYVGSNKAIVQVSATLQLDREVIRTEMYDPDSAVPRSRKSSSKKDEEENKNVSVANNIPNAPQEILRPNRIKSESDEVINYEITKVVTDKVVGGWGSIKQLSIAVLIDGIYVEDKETKAMIYKERSLQDLEKLRALVAAAAGIDEKRGDKLEVLNLKFAQSDEVFPSAGLLDGDTKDRMRFIIQSAVLVIMLVVFGLLLFKPIWSKFFTRTQNETITNMAKNMTNNTSAPTLETEKATEVAADETMSYENLLNYINDFVTKDPATAASTIRNWLYEQR